MLGQDWSGIWLQQFSGTITIWPKSRINDFYYILSDPTPKRLAGMLEAGQQSTFPKLLFIENRMKIERLIEAGLSLGQRAGSVERRKSTTANESMQLRKPLIARDDVDSSSTNERARVGILNQRSTVMEELKRQSGVFFDDVEGDVEDSEENYTSAENVLDGKSS